MKKMRATLRPRTPRGRLLAAGVQQEGTGNPGTSAKEDKRYHFNRVTLKFSRRKMACKLGLQDVSYDPELHTGEVDFDFFDSIDTADLKAQANGDSSIKEEVFTKRIVSNDTINIAEKSIKNNTNAKANSESEVSSDKELQVHSAGNTNGLSCRRDSGTNIESDYGRHPGTEGGAGSTTDPQSDSAPSSPDTERLQAVVRDVAAIQESLHRLRLSADTSQTSPGSNDPAPVPAQLSDPAPSRSSAPAPSGVSAGSGGRLRRPRPRSGWPQRKRWSSSLAEAALTQRQIAQLLRADSDSSSSDMVGVSDSESDSGAAAGSADVETWLGAAAGSGVGSAARSAVSVRSEAGHRPAPAAAQRTGPAAPAGRLGLLAEAVRHLDRAKPRTAPPAPRRPVRAPHRKNMSFTNEEVRQIDRNNRILLNKIVAQQRRPLARPTPAPGGGRSRGTQDQIRRENMILLQKIRTARPSRSVISGFHDTPLPVRPILERGAVRHRPPWVDR